MKLHTNDRTVPRAERTLPVVFGHLNPPRSFYQGLACGIPIGLLLWGLVAGIFLISRG
jgi:hypothetical protein